LYYFWQGSIINSLGRKGSIAEKFKKYCHLKSNLSLTNLAKKEGPLLYRYRYAICTLVTNWQEYECMVNSYRDAGFTEADCEYRYVDNIEGNNFDAYEGINLFLNNADAEYVIISHQDILLSFDKRNILDERIEELNKSDSNWAVLGNAGTNNLYLTSMKVTQQDRICYKSGVLPSKVQSLDENFLIVKKSANIALSRDLSGFHLYGTDICFVAECLGYNAYAVDFNLLHLSHGKPGASFYSLARTFQNKYTNFFRSRYIKTTITSFYIGSNPFVNWLMNTLPVKYACRLYYKYKFKFFRKY